MQIFQIHVELNQHRFMLDAKKSNRWIIEEVYKNELYILRFSYNEVHFDAAFDDHQNTSKCSKKYVFEDFGGLTNVTL